MKILAGNYVLPISTPPVENGAVAIEGTHIIAVGRREEIVSTFNAADIEDLGNVALLPGFVNCHSHLEITSMRGALDDVEHDFSAWLLKLNEIRASLSADDIREAAIAGAMEGIHAGVTCFGDIGRFGSAGFEALHSTGLRGILFQETEFSADNISAQRDFDDLKRRFESLRENETELVMVGLSPHSPYTVSPAHFRLIGEYAIENNVRLTIHAAESSYEDDLLRQGKGFFTDVYRKYNVSWQSPRCSSIEYLDRLGILAAKPLLAHCVTVSESDIDLIAKSGSSIAHCPKSNAKFGHGYAPFEAFKHAGIPVGLGSDSVASNNVCDMLEESRFAALAARNNHGSRRFFTAKEMLEAATLGGAKALGLEDLIGTLEAGKQADIIAVSLDSVAQQPVNDIHTALVFASNSRDVARTIVAGQQIYSRGFSADSSSLRS